MSGTQKGSFRPYSETLSDRNSDNLTEFPSEIGILICNFTVTTEVWSKTSNIKWKV